MNTPAPERRAEGRGFVWRLAAIWLTLQLAYHLGATFPPARALMAAGLNGFAQAAGATLRVAGAPVSVADATLLGEHPLTVARNCDAAPYFFLWIAAVCAFPASGAARSAALLIGVLGLAALNIFRVAALFLILQSADTWFEFAHFRAADGLFILALATGFLCWVAHVRGDRVARPA